MPTCKTHQNHPSSSTSTPRDTLGRFSWPLMTFKKKVNIYTLLNRSCLDLSEIALYHLFPALSRRPTLLTGHLSPKQPAPVTLDSESWYSSHTHFHSSPRRCTSVSSHTDLSQSPETSSPPSTYHILPLSPLMGLTSFKAPSYTPHFTPPSCSPLPHDLFSLEVCPRPLRARTPSRSFTAHFLFTTSLPFHTSHPTSYLAAFRDAYLHHCKPSFSATHALIRHRKAPIAEILDSITTSRTYPSPTIPTPSLSIHLYYSLPSLQHPTLQHPTLSALF